MTDCLPPTAIYEMYFFETHSMPTQYCTVSLPLPDLTAYTFKSCYEHFHTKYSTCHGPFFRQ